MIALIVSRRQASLLQESVCNLCVLSHSVMYDSLQLHGLRPTRRLCTWNFSGKNTGVGCHSLLQRIFLIQGLNCVSCISYIGGESFVSEPSGGAVCNLYRLKNIEAHFSFMWFPNKQSEEISCWGSLAIVSTWLLFWNSKQFSISLWENRKVRA